MNSGPAHDQPLPPTANGLAPPSGPTLPAEVCAGCHRPLTRRGPNGECLRCWMAFALSPDEDAAANRTLRYGHFEVAVGTDGFPVELGSGGMATTYRARDIVLDSDVALKVINKNIAGHPEARGRFLREARAAARLHHPNVAGVSNYGEQDGECYYVMELVEGETLEARVRREGTFPLALTVEVGIQIARALAAAEASGVVHRDLKPSNVMLATRQGEQGRDDSLLVKVIDWGLAKAVTTELMPSADQTRGGFVGTPAFASPEQFAAPENGRIDTRTDIYSLGVTLWYLLAGQTPFTGRTLEEIHARQVNEPLPLGQLAAQRLPAWFVSLLKSMLAVDPAARPQSTRELLDALRRCQERFPVARSRQARLGKFFWWVGVAAVLAAGAGVWWRRAWSPAAPGDESIAVLPFENLSPDEAAAFFTVGMQDEITVDLSRVKDLKVIGSDSTRSYPPKGRDLIRIGRELGVSHLLEGSLRREGGKVQVGLRLVDLHDLAHPWVGRYDRRLEDVFAMQGEITRAVADHLGTKLSDGEKTAVNRPPTTDLAAYDLYLRAREGQKIFKSPSDVRRAYGSRIELLEAAVARDPGFAFAYCELAKLHDRLSFYRSENATGERVLDHHNLAEAALANARRLRPDAGEVHLAQAAHFHFAARDDEQARIEVDLAREALPNSAEVEELAGEIARSQNHWDEALRCLERAVTLEPRENINRFTLANTDRLLRHYDEFDAQMDRLIATMTTQDSVAYRLFRALGRIEQRADLAPLRSAIASVTLADEPSGEIKDEYSLILALCAHDADAVSRILAATTQSHFLINGVAYPKAWFEALAARMRQDRGAERTAFAAARVEVDTIMQDDPTNGRMLSLLAVIDAGLGNQAEATREAQRACEMLPAGRMTLDAPVAASNLAVVYAWTDQPDLACEVLEKWVDRPAGSNLPAQPTYGDLRLNPVWDSLRGNARFAALIARLAPSASR